MRKVIAAIATINLALAVGVAIHRSDHSATTPMPKVYQGQRPYIVPASRHCTRVEHSKVHNPAMPHVATLLKPLRMSDDTTYRPVGRTQSAGVSPESIWRQWLKGYSVESLAHYRVFLARAKIPPYPHSILTWVVLERGVAGPFDASVPAPGPTSIPACVIWGNGETLYNAQTGKEIETGGGGDYHPNPFSPKMSSWWRR